jgi:hypothetical protein
MQIEYSLVGMLHKFLCTYQGIVSGFLVCSPVFITDANVGYPAKIFLGFLHYKINILDA